MVAPLRRYALDPMQANWTLGGWMPQRRLLWVWLSALFCLGLGSGCTGTLEAPSSSSSGPPVPSKTLICPTGLSACKGACVDLSSASEHCGSCETTCTAPAVCASGSCDTKCAEGFEKCGEACSNLAMDAAHCGRCDKACESGQPCFGGVCGCPEEVLFCQGQCFDPKADQQNCGSCGGACLAGAGCVDGTCQCRSGETLCGGECSDLNTPKHCGSCDKACAVGEICAAGACIPSSQACPGTLSRCGDACVELQTSASACGSCGSACLAAQACVNGVCACPAGKTLCGNNCVDLNSSALHCGSCAKTCSAGQSCQAGECKCAAAGALVCDNACADPLSDINHCGNCETKCLGGLPCTEGKCECPAGETLCAGKCVSTDSTAEHCGGCGLPCPAGESCLAGKCSGAIGDACTSTLAVGISIREIAVYQAGKVPIMLDGESVPEQELVTDLVEGKSARVRVFVDLESGWVDRIVSGRLLLANGEDTPSYFSKRTVSQASTDNSFATTFNFDVKAEDITAETRYAVEIVECDGAPAGAAGKPRYPVSDNEPLPTRKTGVLKLRFIPFNANGRTAGSDQARLDVYRQYLEAMYPVTKVEYTVGAVLDISQTISPQGNGWGDALDELSALHENDDAPSDLYYYGLFEPTDEIGQYCGGGCTAGIGFVTGTESFARHQRVSFGLSYGDTGKSTSSSSNETMAHEVGHNHGLDHSPCGGAGGADANYPYAGAKIGWWGYQAPEKLHSPTVATDIMAYCDDQWVSDYVYRSMIERVALLNGAQQQLAPTGGMQHFLFLLTDVTGPRWGVTRKAPRYPSGQAEGALILDATGRVLTSVTVYRTAMDHLGGSVLLVPLPEPGWHAVQVAGAVPLSFGALTSSQP